MKKIVQFTFSALFTLLGLLALPGYTSMPSEKYFPAPIENPAISMYANFEVSGIYNKGEISDQAVMNLLDNLESFSIKKSGETSNPEILRKLAGQFLNEKILNGLFSPLEAFLYINDKDNFALILQGEFNAEKIADLLGKDRFSIQGNRFHSMVRLPDKRLPDLFVQIDNKGVLVCPDKIAPEVLSALNSQNFLLPERKAAFSKMLRIKPAFACEASLENSNLTKEFAEMEWLKSLQHFRLLISQKLVKMQVIVPEHDKRSLALEKFSSFFSREEAIFNDEIQFTCNESGNSVFVETEASLELEQLLSRKKIAFLLQFFVKPGKDNMQISSSNVYEHP